MPDIHVSAVDGQIHSFVTASIQQIAGDSGIKQSCVEFFASLCHHLSGGNVGNWLSFPPHSLSPAPETRE